MNQLDFYPARGWEDFHQKKWNLEVFWCQVSEYNCADLLCWEWQQVFSVQKKPFQLKRDLSNFEGRAHRHHITADGSSSFFMKWLGSDSIAIPMLRKLCDQLEAEYATNIKVWELFLWIPTPSFEWYHVFRFEHMDGATGAKRAVTLGSHPNKTREWSGSRIVNSQTSARVESIIIISIAALMLHFNVFVHTRLEAMRRLKRLKWPWPWHSADVESQSGGVGNQWHLKWPVKYIWKISLMNPSADLSRVSYRKAVENQADDSLLRLRTSYWYSSRMSEAYPEKMLHNSSCETGKGEQLTSFSTGEVSACGLQNSFCNQLLWALRWGSAWRRAEWWRFRYWWAHSLLKSPFASYDIRNRITEYYIFHVSFELTYPKMSRCRVWLF